MFTRRWKFICDENFISNIFIYLKFTHEWNTSHLKTNLEPNIIMCYRVPKYLDIFLGYYYFNPTLKFPLLGSHCATNAQFLLWSLLISSIHINAFPLIAKNISLHFNSLSLSHLHLFTSFSHFFSKELSLEKIWQSVGDLLWVSWLAFFLFFLHGLASPSILHGWVFISLFFLLLWVNFMVVELWVVFRFCE